MTEFLCFIGGFLCCLCLLNIAIKEIIPKEHAAGLRKELESDLYEAVKARCDLIDEATNYWDRSYIQEQLVEILDLVRMSEENEKDDGK